MINTLRCSVLYNVFYGLPFWASQLWLCSACLMYVVMPVCTPTDCECYRLVLTTYWSLLRSKALALKAWAGFLISGRSLQRKHVDCFDNIITYHFTLVAICYVFCFETRLGSNLCKALTRHNTTENFTRNRITSASQHTALLKPNITHWLLVINV